MADLDTQRHVTSRTYEAFCWEGRHSLLAELGYGLQRMFEDRIRLNVLITHCSFSREQHPGNPLLIHTWLELAENRQYWYQQVTEPDGAVACIIATVTELIDASGELLALDHQAKSPQDTPGVAKGVEGASSGQALPVKASERSVASGQSEPPERSAPAERSEPNEPSDRPEPMDPPVAPLSFSSTLPADLKPPGRAGTVETIVTAPFSDRSPFFDFPPGAFWKMIEEGRWGFSHAVGLDEDRIREVDTVTFFTSGTFHIYRQPTAGATLQIQTWVDRIEKIRCFLRSDIRENGELICSNIEEQLVVSLSRRRPRKAPPEFVAMVQPYLENPFQGS